MSSNQTRLTGAASGRGTCGGLCTTPATCALGTSVCAVLTGAVAVAEAALDPWSLALGAITTAFVAPATWPTTRLRISTGGVINGRGDANNTPLRMTSRCSVSCDRSKSSLRRLMSSLTAAMAVSCFASSAVCGRGVCAPDCSSCDLKR